ncbi:MAG TPA: 2-dehydropantoate 2-reductase [Hyphomicrobiaceae bacterium]|nr:2-dehydropantoate 2-reductase [Hyphomicrobiaceae bacterium]
MRVLIIGAGAIGGWLAAALARGGADVALLARGATLAAVRTHGMVLLEGDRRSVFHLPASDRARDLPPPETVVLAVKTHAFAEAVAWDRDAFAGAPLLVTAMNGLPWWFLEGLPGPLKGQRLESVDPGGRAAAMLTGVRPLGAVVHSSARAEAPGVLRVAAVDRLILGEPEGGVSHETEALAGLVQKGGVNCPITTDIRTEIWSKLWGNMNMNPVSALTRRTANGILGDDRLLALVHDMMSEFVRIGECIGISLPMSVDERLVVTRRLGDFRTSMLNDLEAGRALEIEGLLGVVVEMADKLGEPVPASRAVYALARAINPGGAA